MKPIITRNFGKHAMMFARQDGTYVVHLTKQLAEELHFEASIKPRYYQLWMNKAQGRIGMELVRERTPYSRNISFLPSGGIQFGVGKVLYDMDVSIPRGNYPMKWEFNRNGFPHLVLNIPMHAKPRDFYDKLADAKIERDVMWEEGKSKCCNADIEEGGKPEFEVKPGQPYIYTSYPKCTECGRACGIEVIKILEEENGN